MGRLIDADDLKNVFEGDSCTENPNPHFPLYMVKNDIDKAPTVEAVPVAQGEWIHVPSSDMATGKAYECSNCKKMRYGSFMPPFCQMCGADMRTSAE